MNPNDSNFDLTKSDPLGQDPARPSPIGEGEVMAYVEGELSPAREAQVRAWIGQRPRMQARLEDMRRERGLLSSLEDEPAPAGLLEGAMQLAERSMLLDDGTADFSALPPAPISITKVRRKRSYLPQLAGLAAAVIVVAAGSYALWPRAPLTVPGPVAMKSSDAAATLVAPAGATAETPALAKMDAAPEAPSVEVAAAAAEEMVGPRMPRPTTEISRERALLLAGEGRLVVKVSALEPGRTIAAVNNLLKTAAGRELGMGRASPTAVMAMVERPSPRVLFRDRTLEADEMIVAGPDAIADETARAERRQHAIEVPAVHAVYVAEITADAAAIGALVDALSNGPDRVVLLQELPEAPWTTPKIDEETVLWWEQPAANWDKRVSVPVVVEGM